MYSKKIEETPFWELAEIYSDRGKSGTMAKHRPGFQKMIADAEAGKLDIILVKSISRFSRNVGECQRYVDILRACNVSVIFEREHIRSDEPTSNFALALIGATAQDESHSISENRRWAYQKQYAEGRFNMGNNRILGYDSVGGKLVPNQDAGAVRLIYQMYLEGKSIEEIRRLLADYGVRARKGSLISHSDILYILRNETYRGDKHLQKQAPKDFLTKKPDTRQKFDSYYLEGDHEAIVDKAVWDAVQEKLRQNKGMECVVGHRGGRPHFLYGKVFCGICGAPMTRRTVNTVGGAKCKVWTCRERHKGRKGNGCKGRNISEEELLKAISDQLGKPANQRNAELLERVVVEEQGVTVASAIQEYFTA